jgi:uncharacterized glyoxalase superfamily protein PhnB
VTPNAITEQADVQTVTPSLLYEYAAAALEWPTQAFGFHQLERQAAAARGLRREPEVEPEGAPTELGSPPGDFRRPAPTERTSLVYVLVDEHGERSLAARHEIIEEPADLPHGDRRHPFRDPQLREWCFAVPIAS